MRLQETLQQSLRSEIEKHQKQNSYTLLKLSELSGINQGHLSDIIRNNRPMTIGQLDACESSHSGQDFFVSKIRLLVSSS